tara:strand:- start:7535 stop:8320 length:786 start_codon:yes stop_codon:yes gene_type:complete
MKSSVNKGNEKASQQKATQEAKEIAAKKLSEIPQSVETESAEMTLIKDLQAKINRLEAKASSSNEESLEPSVEDDYLEDPVMFFSYGSTWRVYGDKRRGKIVHAPVDGGIKFSKAYRYERRTAARRGMEIVSVCSVTVQSKALVKWLREHTLFGVKFFESISDASSVDVTFAEKMTEINHMVSNMSDMQAVERARMEGVNTNTPDIDLVRKQLVEKLTRKDLNAESNNKKSYHVNSLNAAQAGESNKLINKGVASGQDVYT